MLMSRPMSRPRVGRPRRRVAAGAGVLVMFLAGCGIATQRQPQAISTRNVPFGLLSPTPSSSGTVAPQHTVVEIWVVRHGRLLPLHIRAPLPGRPDQAMRVLLGGLPSADVSRGLGSAIPDGTRLLSFDLVGSVARIDLSPQFAQARSRDQILAVAQLVYTATYGGEATAVSFSIADKPIEVPELDGSLTGRPVSRLTYSSLVQPA